MGQRGGIGAERRRPARKRTVSPALRATLADRRCMHGSSIAIVVARLPAEGRRQQGERLHEAAADHDALGVGAHASGPGQVAGQRLPHARAGRAGRRSAAPSRARSAALGAGRPPTPGGGTRTRLGCPGGGRGGGGARRGRRRRRAGRACVPARRSTPRTSPSRAGPRASPRPPAGRRPRSPCPGRRPGPGPALGVEGSGVPAAGGRRGWRGAGPPRWPNAARPPSLELEVQVEARSRSGPVRSHRIGPYR